MKLRVLSILLALVLLAGCSSTLSDRDTFLDDDIRSANEVYTDRPEDEPAPEAPKPPETPQEILDYVATLEDVVSDTSTVTYEARGKSVVYKFTYKTVTAATDEQIAALNEALEASRADSLTALKQVQSDCSAVESIIYEYYDAKGNLMLSKEFK